MINATYRCMNCGRDFTLEMFDKPSIPDRAQLNHAWYGIAENGTLVRNHTCWAGTIGFAYPVRVEIVKEEEEKHEQSKES